MIHEKGFTLVELLISLVISSILLLGISTFLIASKASWRKQLQLTSSQEIERFTVFQLRRAIRQASSVMRDSDQNQLILSYVAHEGSRNCLGQLRAAGETYIDRFHVSEDQLRCNGEGLISGLSSIQFSYGMDRNKDDRIDQSEYDSKPDSCCAVGVVEFELSLSGINEAQSSILYSATVRRY